MTTAGTTLSELLSKSEITTISDEDVFLVQKGSTGESSASKWSTLLSGVVDEANTWTGAQTFDGAVTVNGSITASTLDYADVGSGFAGVDVANTFTEKQTITGTDVNGVALDLDGDMNVPTVWTLTRDGVDYVVIGSLITFQRRLAMAGYKIRDIGGLLGRAAPLVVGDNTTSHGMSNDYDLLVSGKTEMDGAVYMDNLPTSDPADAGALWNDAGTIKISSG